VQAAKKMAAELHGDALDTLVEFGATAQRLRELADFIVKRKY
jgi:farnesyl diphosphate synthase